MSHAPQQGSFDRVAKIYDATRGLPPAAEDEVAAALIGILRRAGDRVHSQPRSMSALVASWPA